MKLMKKLSVCVFAMCMFITMVGGVKAYDQNIQPDDNNIDIAVATHENKNYVAIKGSLKNDAAKVYMQEIQINKETFDALNTNNTAWINYSKANANIVNTGTEAQIAEFNAKDAEYAATEKSLIPSFNESNWKELTLTETTASENKYSAALSNDNAYFVVWVKVSLNGQDYYDFEFNCLEQNETPTYKCQIVDGKYYGLDGSEITKEKYTTDCEKKVCRIEGGKYYDKDGKEVSKADYYKACPNPKTGNNTYYTYGIITVIGAFVLYMFTRRIKKFSK